MFLILQESARSSAEPGIEALITEAVAWMKLGVETFAALIIAAGALIAAYQIVRALASPRTPAYYRIRLNFSRFLALALEFQLGADLLGTTISPSWNQLGQLGAIAVIRTVLNFFLAREMREEEERSAITPASLSAEEEKAAT